MTATVTNLWRHPIKSHGREALERVDLAAGKCLPWDRHWAVTHDNSRFDGSGWAECANFMLGTRTPGLAGLWATLDEAAARVTLRHSALGEIAFAPDDPADAARFLEWVRPLCPDGRAMPLALVKADGRGMTDTSYPSVSIINRRSHDEVAQRLGKAIEPERWRANIWCEGPAPWDEFDWIGRRLRIGGATLEVRARITRCLHTAANPHSGERDADTLGALKSGWNHQDFGIYAEVVADGPVAVGDPLQVL